MFRKLQQASCNSCERDPQIERAMIKPSFLAYLPLGIGVLLNRHDKPEYLIDLELVEVTFIIPST